MPHEFSFTFRAFTESFSHANGSFVVWMNETNHMSFIKFFESILESATCSFRCITLAPEFASQRPPNLERGPTGGIQKPNPSGKLTTALFLNCEMAVAQQLPMTNDER